MKEFKDQLGELSYLNRRANKSRKYEQYEQVMVHCDDRNNNFNYFRMVTHSAVLVYTGPCIYKLIIGKANNWLYAIKSQRDKGVVIISKVG